MTGVDTERARLFRLASRLLEYPDEALFERFDEVTGRLSALPRSPARTALARLADWLCDTEPIEAARHYVATFDLRRRCSLYLTYYLHGDTRRRGMALLVLKQRYRAAGLDPTKGSCRTTCRWCLSSPGTPDPRPAKPRCGSTGPVWS